MREYATLEHLSVGDIPGIAEFCERESIDLTVVGPEMPLVAGLADELLDRGLPVFGPTRDAAMIEGSKTWARELCLRHGIPGPLFGAFTDPSEALEFLDRLEAPFVVKADGLAAGKGVTIAETRAEAERAIEDCLVARVFGDAGARVVLEEHLTGIEVSAFAHDRRQDGPAADHGAGLQAGTRRRPGAEHRRDGRVQPAAVRGRRARAARSMRTCCAPRSPRWRRRASATRASCTPG